jgi:hypothetical protein
MATPVSPQFSDVITFTVTQLGSGLAGCDINVHPDPTVDYRWDFGDGTSATTGETVMHHSYSPSAANCTKYDCVYNATLHVTTASGDDWLIIVYPVIFPATSEPLAVPGGPYSVIRGHAVRLDGSRSLGQIISYAWTFENPGVGVLKNCKAGASLKTGHKTGARPTVVMLCTMRATLTVSDGRKRNSATTTIRVRARDWKTPVRFVRYIVGGRPPTPWKPPTLRGAAGLNVSACPHATTDPAESDVCPLSRLLGTWNDNGYRLLQVHDPGGPFDRWWYAGSSTLTVDTQALLNPYLFKGAPRSALRESPNFYTENAQKGTDVQGYVAAVREHESWGKPGTPRSGHTSAMNQPTTRDGGLLDPRKGIEQILAPSKQRVIFELDRNIRGHASAIENWAADPLTTIWTGALYLWSASAHTYERQQISVGGTD